MAKKSTTLPVTRKARFPGGIEVQWVNITPKIAQGWLKKKNVPVNGKEADKISREILAGRAGITGKNPIVFYNDGTLAFGQDDLMGIVKSKTAKSMLVICGINRRLNEIDCLTPWEYFKRNGVAYSIEMVAVTKRVLARRELGGGVISRLGRVKKFSNTELWEEYYSNQTVYDDCVRYAYSVYNRSSKILKVSAIASFCVYAKTDLGWSQADIESAIDEMITALTTGAVTVRSRDLMTRISTDESLRSRVMTSQYRDGYFVEFCVKYRSGIDTPLTYTPATHGGLKLI